MTVYRYVDSPIGLLLLAGADGVLARLHFSRGSKARQPDPLWAHGPDAFPDAARQLHAYFAGELRQFDLPLNPAGTPFQLSVWRELLRIPYGVTSTYGEVAKRLGNPAASRAVGLANGANPIAIIQPCHRVIGVTGKLTGFGGGLDLKERLLRLESGERDLFQKTKPEG